MVNLGNFDPSEHESSFEPIPVGEYQAIIRNSEKKETKSGTGSYLNLTFEIVAGQHKGRTLFDILNLWNPNPKAVEIANQQLAKIAKAVGVQGRLNDSHALHNVPLTIKVDIEEDNQGNPRNKIKAYKRRSGGAQAAPTPEKAPYEV